MERNIQKHWQEEVAKVVKARKGQNLTQERLAAITGISTQTLSRFEQAKEDVQLSTILKVLDTFALRLTLDYSYEFKVLVYRILIDAIKTNPSIISGLIYDDDKNELYQFLKKTNEEMCTRGDKIDVLTLPLF